MAVLSENRFILGLGAGERLNEDVVGEGWPGIGERHERLSEAYDIIRGLLDGTIENYRGKYFTLDDAKLYDRPERAPAIIGAAGGPEAARLAGRKADGMITTVPQGDLIEAFRSAGGNGPLYAEVPMCYAASEDRAREVAHRSHRYHRWSLAGGPVMPELPDTGTFAAASSHITPDHVAEEVSLDPSPESHLEAIRKVYLRRFRPPDPDSDRTGAGSVLRVLRTRVAQYSCVVEAPRTSVAELRSVSLLVAAPFERAALVHMAVPPDPERRRLAVRFVRRSANVAATFLARIFKAVARHLSGGDAARHFRGRETALPHAQPRDRQPRPCPLCRRRDRQAGR